MGIYFSIMVNFFIRYFCALPAFFKRGYGLFSLFLYSWPSLLFAQSSSLNNTVNFTASQIWLVILLLMLIFLLLLYRQNRHGIYTLPRKQFAYLEISKSQHQIGLYRLHQTNTDTVINIADLISCKVMLNDQLINLITAEQANEFNNQQQAVLLRHFACEYREKMHSKKTRRINLVLIDKEQQQYDICLYLRTGNKRITKYRYDDVIEDILDWCWLLSAQINSFHHQIRKKVDDRQAAMLKKKPLNSCILGLKLKAWINALPATSSKP